MTTTRRNEVTTDLKTLILRKFEFDEQKALAEFEHNPCSYRGPSDRNSFGEGARWQHNQIKNEVLPILFELGTTLEIIENYLNFSTDDLCGDDLIGDKKKTTRFESRIKQINLALAAYNKFKEEVGL